MTLRTRFTWFRGLAEARTREQVRLGIATVKNLTFDVDKNRVTAKFLTVMKLVHLRAR
jgi:hypothetical protein